MTDNFASIHQLLRDSLEQYEQSRSGVSADPHQRLLAALEHPYMTFPNHDAFLSALRQELTAEECRAWFAYPDFSYRTDALRPEEASANADADLKGNFRRSVRQPGSQRLSDADAKEGRKHRIS